MALASLEALAGATAVHFHLTNQLTRWPEATHVLAMLFRIANAIKPITERLNRGTQGG